MKKIDVSSAKVTLGSGYPPPHDEPCRQRTAHRIRPGSGEHALEARERPPAAVPDVKGGVRRRAIARLRDHATLIRCSLLHDVENNHSRGEPRRRYPWA